MDKTTFIRYDCIPFQDFLNVYNLYSIQNIKTSLIDISKLREFLFIGNKIKDKNEKKIFYPIKLFFIIEYDYIRNIHNSYFLFQSSLEIQDELEKLAKRIKIELKLKNIDTLFRIDPKYGLIVGSTKEAIDNLTTQDKPNCFITLYISNDPNHPEIALYDYVEKPYKKKYIEIFEKHNHCSPGSFKILGFDMSKFKKLFVKSAPQTIIFYNDIVELGNSLIHKQKLENITISLIYEDVSENEASDCLLDKKKLSYFPSGYCKFFISIDELLQA